MFLYNWSQPGITGTYNPDDLNLEDTRVLVTGMPVDKIDFKNVHITMTLMHARGAKLPLLCVEAQEAAAIGDDDRLAYALIGITVCWQNQGWTIHLSDKD